MLKPLAPITPYSGELSFNKFLSPNIAITGPQPSQTRPTPRIYKSEHLSQLDKLGLPYNEHLGLLFPAHLLL